MTLTAGWHKECTVQSRPSSLFHAACRSRWKGVSTIASAKSTRWQTTCRRYPRRAAQAQQTVCATKHPCSTLACCGCMIMGLCVSALPSQCACRHVCRFNSRRCDAGFVLNAICFHLWFALPEPRLKQLRASNCKTQVGCKPRSLRCMQVQVLMAVESALQQRMQEAQQAAAKGGGTAVAAG